MAYGLPDGFTLDENPSALPEGFQLDEENFFQAAGRNFDNLSRSSYGVANNIKNAAIRGWLSGEAAMELQNGSRDAQKIADIQTRVKELAPSQDYQLTWDDNVTPAESWKAFTRDPVGNLGQLLAESLGAQTRTQLSYLGKIPERTAQVTTGATAAGLVGAGPPGAAAMVVPGALVGAGTGFAESSMLASYANEYANSYLNSLEEAGVDIRDQKSLQDALDNPQKYQELAKKAQAKAVPIGVFDGISSAVAGRLFTSPAKTVGKKAIEWGTELLGQMFAGGAGEAVGQLASEGKITSPRSILAEVVAEPVSSIVELGVGKGSQAILNPAEVQKQARVEVMDEAAANADENYAPQVAEELAKQADIVESTPAEVSEEAFDRVVEESELVNNTPEFAPPAVEPSQAEIIEEIPTSELPAPVEEEAPTVLPPPVTQEEEVTVVPPPPRIDIPPAPQPMIIDVPQDVRDGATTGLGSDRVEAAEQALQDRGLFFLEEINQAYRAAQLMDQGQLAEGMRAEGFPEDQIQQATGASRSYQPYFESQARKIYEKYGLPYDQTTLPTQPVDEAPQQEVTDENNPPLSRGERLQRTQAHNASLLQAAQGRASEVGQTPSGENPSTPRLSVENIEAETSIPASDIERFPKISRGTMEHDVRYNPDTRRAIKTTRPEEFGVFTDLSGEDASTRYATLQEYIDRIRLFNEVFDSDIQIEGVTRLTDELDDSRQEGPVIVTSQAWEAPVDPNNAEPTQEQADDYMRSLGFQPGRRTNQWFRPSDGIYVSDARKDNFVLTQDGVRAIDLLVTQGTPNATQTIQEPQGVQGQPESRTESRSEKGPSPGDSVRSTTQGQERRVKLRSSPQTYAVVEELPQSELERNLGEKYFRVRNERTGKEEVVEQGDMQPVGLKGRRGKRNVQNTPEPSVPASEGPVTDSVEATLKANGFTDEELAGISEEEKAAMAQAFGRTSDNPTSLRNLSLPAPNGTTIEEKKQMMQDLLKLGVMAKESPQKAAKVLRAISKDSKNLPEAVRRIADTLQRGDFRSSEFEVINNSDLAWGAAYDGTEDKFWFNVGAKQRGPVSQILLHEYGHNFTLMKLRGEEELNKAETEAVENLRALYERAKQEIPQARQWNPETMQGEYGLSSLEEFVSEVYSNPEFQALLDRIPASPNSKRSILSKFWYEISKLFKGQNIDPNSVLTKAIENAFTLSGVQPEATTEASADIDLSQSNGTADDIGNLIRARNSAVPPNDLTQDQRAIVDRYLVSGENRTTGLPEIVLNKYLTSRRVQEADRQELLSAARQGLITGVRRYDPSKGNLEPWLAQQIKYAIQHEWKRQLTRNERFATTVDQPAFAGEVETRGEQIPSKPEAQAVEEDAVNLGSDILRDLNLSERDLNILTLRSEGLTLRQIGDQVGLSYEMIRRVLDQIETNARRLLRDYGITDPIELFPQETPEPVEYRRSTPTLEDEEDFQAMREQVVADAEKIIQDEESDAALSIAARRTLALQGISEKNFLTFARDAFSKVSNFAQWAKQMLQQFGNGVRNVLRETYNFLNTGGIEFLPGREGAGNILAGRIPGFPVRAGNYQPGGLFSAAGNWNREIFKRLQTKEHNTTANLNAVEFLDKMMSREIKALRKKGENISTQTINTALGNTDNRLTNEQYQEARSIKDPIERQSFELTAKLENQEIARAQQKAAFDSLPPSLQSIVGEMRDRIDFMSNQLVASGAISGDMKATIGDNLGIYLHRSYSIFDDPEAWKSFIQSNSPEAVRTRNKAEQMFSSSIKGEAAAEVYLQAKRDGNPITRQQAFDAVKDLDFTDQVRVMFEDYLSIADEGAVSILRGRLPGQKNQSIITLRGQIPQEIRDLWGEQKDATTNFAKTYASIAMFLENHKFLTGVLEDGLITANNPDGYIWKEGVSPTARPNGYKELVTQGNKSMAPLNGAWMPAELVEAFETYYQGNQSEGILRLVQAATSFAMLTKTAYSWASTVRNFLGNIMFMVANGHINLGKLNEAQQSTISNFLKMGDRQRRDRVARYIELGIVNDNVGPRLIQEIADRARIEKTGNAAVQDNKVLSTLWDGAKFTNEKALEIYGSVDDFWKVYAFENELDKLKKASPGVPLEQLEREAAIKVRRTVPTYSESYDIVRKFRQGFGVALAPFITFTTEVIRTSVGTAQTMWEETHSPNPEVRKIGYQRLGGMIAAALVFPALSMIAKKVWDYDDDEEEALRNFLPEWQKDAQIILLSRDPKGDPRFVDVSYLDPYGYFKEPLIAAFREFRSGKPAEEIAQRAVTAGLGRFVEPFSSEQIFASALFDIARNTKSNGAPVFNPQDSPQNQLLAKSNRIYEAFEPGTLTSLRRIYKAFTSQQGPTGRAYDPANELSSFLLGQRITTYDTRTGLDFAAGHYKGDNRDATSVFMKPFKSRGSVPEGRVEEAYRNANNAKRKVVQDLRNDYKSAVLLGVPASEAKKILKDAEIGEDALREVTTGVYRQYKPSKDQIQEVRKKNPERVKELNEAMKEAPQREELR